MKIMADNKVQKIKITKPQNINHTLLEGRFFLTKNVVLPLLPLDADYFA